jgi:hypothetical protein
MHYQHHQQQQQQQGEGNVPQYGQHMPPPPK